MGWSSSSGLFHFSKRALFTLEMAAFTLHPPCSLCININILCHAALYICIAYKMYMIMQTYVEQASKLHLNKL